MAHSSDPGQVMDIRKMSATRQVTFCVAVNDSAIFQNNFMASPCFQGAHHHHILTQKNFGCAAKAYNDAIDRSANDLIVFAHQDVLFPEQWLSQLERALNDLEATDPKWGVLGCYGLTCDGTERGHVYSAGRDVFGRPFEHPTQVQTLDEIVLILRKSSGLRFDERLPHFHLYGADICLAAAKKGMNSYAIPAFCIHNTQQNLVLPREFYECCTYMKLAWKDHLPIHATCMSITESNWPLYRRKLKELYLRLRGKRVGAFRATDPRRLLEEFRTQPQSFSRGRGLSFWTRVGWLLRDKRATEGRTVANGH
jgi:hypothetical protein